MKYISIFTCFLLIAYYKSPRIFAQQIDVDAYPKIIHFPESELLLHGDKKRTASLQVTCRATGQQPLSYKWLLSNKNTAFKTKEYLTGDKGDLFIQIPLYRDPYQAVCVVSNKYGTVFSNPRQVEIAAVTSPFKSGPLSRIAKLYYSFGHPLTVACPPHEVHLTADYSWGTYKHNTFNPLKESKHWGITTKGSLVFTFIKKTDVRQILHCKVSVGATELISRGYGFSSARSKTQYGSVFAMPAALVEKPQAYEMARRGSTKTMRCIPTGNPDPSIVWFKDGSLVVNGQNDIKLESFNRILVITNVNEKKHAGRYQCGVGESTYQTLASTHLYVTGSPVITKRPPESLTIDAKQQFTLECRAKQMFSASQEKLYYGWYKNSKPIVNSSNKTIVHKNALTVLNAMSVDSGVYQCIAHDFQGSTTTSTRVHVKEKMCPAISAPLNSKFSERSCHVHSMFNAGVTCTVLCDRGFFGKGRRSYRKCLEDGGWSVMQYVCEDNVPPKLRENCPKHIIIATDINNDTGAQVTWKPPSAMDNSGKLVTKIEPKGIMENSHWFPVGDHVIKYRFIDFSGQDVSCEFPITVFTRTTIVSKPPSLIYILKGRTLSLPCFAVSYPIKPFYTWKKSSFTDINKAVTIRGDSPRLQLINGGESLVIVNVNDEDNGKYVCEVVNTYYNVPGTSDTAVLSIEVVQEVQWSSWQPWSRCDVKKCGKGSRVRKRTCYKRGTLRSAIGCEGPETEKKSCHVKCPTTTPTPLSTPSTPPTIPIKDIAEEARIFGHVVGKYENKARGWIKQRSPWLYSWLDTTEGRVGFAVSLGLLGTVIVLVSWFCSRFFSVQRKTKVRFEDEQKISKHEKKVKADRPESTKTQNPPSKKEPEYENTMTTPIYENSPLLEGHYENYNNKDTTSTGNYYENTIAIDDQYENTTAIEGHYQNTSATGQEGHYQNTLATDQEGHYQNISATEGHYQDGYFYDDGQLYEGEDGYYYGNDHYGDEDMVEEDMVTE